MQQQSTCPVCGNALEPGSAACPSCGYKPQGSTQSFQPIAFEDERIDASPAPEQVNATLRIVRGPQTGASFELGDAPLPIGRSPQCDIFLNDMTVSRQHAELTPSAGSYIIHDTNSFNGVWIDNASIDSRLLKPGDIVQIGAFCLLYQND